MTRPPLLEALQLRRLVCDGAMGTQLMLAGLESGGCGEAWNLTHPERVLAIQRRYADAGADCIITNTFGGSRIMLRRHEHEKELAAINAAGVRITREAFGGRPGYVLGMDGTFYKTMMGVAPEQAAEFAQERGAHIIALNCGTGMDMHSAAMVGRAYRASCSLPVMVQPNAGLPVLENLKAVYKQLPADMAKDVPEVLATGVGIIGSCCGSTPDHTRAIRAVMDGFNKTK